MKALTAAEAAKARPAAKMSARTAKTGTTGKMSPRAAKPGTAREMSAAGTAARTLAVEHAAKHISKNVTHIVHVIPGKMVFCITARTALIVPGTALTGTAKAGAKWTISRSAGTASSAVCGAVRVKCGVTEAIVEFLFFWIT